ncbi:MAG: WbuC family cupin fold metalloprotein [Bacteroidales bacterium]|nr:WbuC family cupin fold metalloprotein [Bacteroidales bacterium]
MYGVDIPKNTWHKLESLEPGSVIFECKAGPYEPQSPADVMQV